MALSVLYPFLSCCTLLDRALILKMIFRICYILFTWYVLLMPVSGDGADSQETDYCEADWIPFEDYCYYVNAENKVPFNEASNVCQSMGGNLTSIHNDEEQAFHTEDFEDKTEVWIGLHDRTRQDHFEWIDGSAFDYANWETKLPNDLKVSRGNKAGTDCTYLKHNGEWKIQPCVTSHGFICKKPQGHKTTMTTMSTKKTMMSSTTETMMSSTTETMTSSTTQPIIPSTTETTMTSTTEAMMSSTTKPMMSSTSKTMMSSTTESMMSSTSKTMMSSTTESMMSSTSKTMMTSATNQMMSSTTKSTTADCGLKCPKEISCSANVTNTSIGMFSWTTTLAGLRAESNEICPNDTERQNHGKASRKCTNGGEWRDPVLIGCGIEDLANTHVTEDNVAEIADALANIIRDSENIDIEDVQEAFTNIVNVGSPSQVVTENVIKTVNSILSANVSQERDSVANALSEILKSVEMQVEYTIEMYGKFSSVKPNIAVEGVAVNKTQQSGVGFAISQNNEGFEEDSNQSFDPDMQSEDQLIGSSIQLPMDALFENENTNDTKVSFIAYNDDKLFPSQMLKEKTSSMVVGPIISAVVLGKDVINLKKPVIIQIAPTQDINETVLNTFKCVSWDFSKSDGIGDWAENGCALMSAESGKITCHCNHLTNFAVLVDFSGGTMNFALDVISKVGCAFSIVGLCLTLMIFLCCRGLRISLQRKILIQFCISMLGLYFAFLLGIDSTGSEIGCIIVAALLHYFVLTTVLWMGVEARHMYITLVAESDRVGRKFMFKASFFAWGVGLIPVGVVLAIKQGHYVAKPLLYCFVAPDYGLFFGLLLPIGLVILHNIITFGLVARKLLSSRAYVMKSDLENREADDEEVFQKTGVREISQRLLNAFAVSILLGITWVFGFLAIEEARMVFQLLFCICNSFQGVLIFILFCYGQKDVRKIICARCFSEPPSQPKVKQMKKPAATGATAVSSDTRLTGESYTEDNDTLITKIDGMTMIVLESETTDSHEDIDEKKEPNKSDAKEPATSGKSDNKVKPSSNGNEAESPKHGSNSEPLTEQTGISSKSEADDNGK
ncbi:adhesion G-protein coupled receptor G7-like isoform X2 [Amphiura filiformis]|uniref:adhesion G-protein coupled receptor G7-like isoform X2 n=1 Tax=Amphiura filiformis TaxID=82378 RepID=UPI003B214CD4